MPLAHRLAQVQSRLVAAAQRVGRNPTDITLVGVSKSVGRATVMEAYQAGLRDFGENRVPDAEERFTPLPYPDRQARLHLIGHLQTNKVKRAVALADFIHSVDSLRLAEAISRHCQESGKVMPVLLQVNVSGEETKQGLEPAELPAHIASLEGLPGLELRGLMVIAPNYALAEQTRPVFAGLRELFERYNPGIPSWRELSMGMTNDFEIAIEEGSTLVRVGRAIFSDTES